MFTIFFAVGWSLVLKMLVIFDFDLMMMVLEEKSVDHVSAYSHLEGNMDVCFMTIRPFLTFFLR